MVHPDARQITHRFIQVWAARMRNTLLPVEAKYLSFTGIHGVQMNCRRWRVSSPADVVVVRFL
jgi:hypothetical protein